MSSTLNPKPQTLNSGTMSTPAMSSTRLEAAQMAREAMPTVDASADDCMDLHPVLNKQQFIFGWIDDYFCMK